MELNIEQFKGIKNSHYNINKGVITLIKGDVGTGKSTLLLSIYWCLYGFPKSINNIYNNKRCKVCMIMNDIDENAHNKLIITRKTKTNMLIVEMGDNKYINDVAQNIIDARYGSKTIFDLFSFIRIDPIKKTANCPLLSLEKKHRAKYLSEIVFMEGTKPDIVIKAIMEEMLKAKSSYIVINEIYHKSLNNYKNAITRRPAVRLPNEYKESSDILTKINSLAVEINSIGDVLISIPRLELKIRWLGDQILAENTKITNSRTLVNSILNEHPDIEAKIHINTLDHKMTADTIKQSIYEIRDKIDQKTILLERDRSKRHLILNVIGALKTSLSVHAERSSRMYKRYDDRRNLLNNADNMDVEMVLILPPILEQLFEDLDLYNNNTHTCSDLRISYTKESILSEIERLEKCIEDVGAFHNLSAIIRKRHEIIALLKDVRFDDLSNISTTKLELKMLEILSQEQMISCPNCNESFELDITNKFAVGSFVDSPGADNSIKENITVKRGHMEDMLLSLLKLKDLKEQYEKELQDIYNMYPHIEDIEKFGISNANKLSYYQASLKTLRNIKLVKKPIYTSSNELNNIKTYYTITSNLFPIDDSIIPDMVVEIEMEETKLKAVGEALDIIDNEIKILQSDNTTNISMLTKYNYIEQVITLRKDIKDSEDLIDRLTNKLNNKKKKLSKYMIIKDKHTMLTNSLKRCEDEHSEAIYTDKCISEMNGLILERDEVVSNQQKLLTLKKLYNNALYTQYQGLAAVIKYINNILPSVIIDMFSFPVTIEFYLTKVIKRGHMEKVKLELGAKITRIGVECDYTGVFSTGEMGIVALAIFISLNIFYRRNKTTLPIIMIDELMAGQDDDIMKKCAQGVRKLLEKEMFIFVAEHHADETDYDDIIPLIKYNPQQ